MMNKRIVALFLLLLASVQLPPVLLAADDTDKVIREAVGKILPGIPVNEITPSPLPGISEVIIGAKLFYISNDGKYIMQGSLIELATRTDLSERRLDGIRRGVIKDVKTSDMIIFPADEERYVITVFTDIDCGYCRKLHAEINQYNALGITVQYLMYPRSGPNTPSFDKAISVWCSKDRLKALTQAKAGENLPKKVCDNPVSAHYGVGQEIGVRGTPAILLENGEILPGYLPAPKLANELAKRG
jgi:thiol:disulfide interchange protein DsbC